MPHNRGVTSDLLPVVLREGALGWITMIQQLGEDACASGVCSNAEHAVVDVARDLVCTEGTLVWLSSNQACSQQSQ